jgi:hypothetical protein
MKKGILTEPYTESEDFVSYTLSGKGKNSPITGLDPEGFRRLRLPVFKIIGTLRW